LDLDTFQIKTLIITGENPWPAKCISVIMTWKPSSVYFAVKDLLGELLLKITFGIHGKIKGKTSHTKGLSPDE